jgi:LysR family transcriptional regulator, nitrogen assimilation regulatory protein
LLASANAKLYADRPDPDGRSGGEVSAASMPVQLRHLRYFVRIVEAGSFSRAATLVHIAQPALSQQIAELELELGVPLLIRGPRGTHPTPAGDILYHEAVSILGRMDQLPELVRASGPEI